MRWAPLAALSCSYASSLSAAAAFTIRMPAASGVRRVLAGCSGGRRRLHLSGSGSVAGTMALRIRLPPARPAARRVFQQRMASSSVSEQQQRAGKAAAAAARQRASSRYIPSDFRGVRGGPKGKWKARLVSKGQLRQLGTFESELDAARAYNKAALSLHGAAAKLNVLPDEAPAKTSAPALEGDPAAAAGKKSKRAAATPATPAVTTEAQAAESFDSGRSAGSTPGSTTQRGTGGDGVANVSSADGGTAATAAHAYRPGELYFRDLEEIPESTGPALWDDDFSLESTWLPGMAELEAVGSDAASAAIGGKRISNTEGRFVPVGQTEVGVDSIRESLFGGEDGGLAEGLGGAGGGAGAPPGDGLFLGDEASPAASRPSVPSPPTRTAAKTPRASVVAGMASVVGGEVEAIGAGRRHQRQSSTLASSEGQAAASVRAPPPPTGAAARTFGGTGNSGSDQSPPPPPASPPQFVEERRGGIESAAAAAAASPDAAYLVAPAEARLASAEGPMPVSTAEKVAASAASGGGNGQEWGQQGGAEGAGGGAGVGGDWRDSTGVQPRGAAGWDREETGDELYEERLRSVVDVSTGLHGYWMEPLMGLTKPETRKVAMQLTSDNKLGYRSQKGGPIGKGSLLRYVLEQKEKHPTKVLLIRVGEFYETYGVDAVMLMQHAGLNQMGREVRAGCPRKNVQQTLDSLTSAGLTVAVYEEMNDVDAQRGPSAKKSIKERALSQVVSPGSPNYLYEGCLRTDDISFRESKPYVGVMKDTSGYLLCQIYTDEREVQVSERMTEEAVRVAIEEAGVAEPIFDQGTGLTFLPDHTEQLTGFPSAAFPGQILSRVARLLELAESDLRHFRTVTRTPEGRPRAVYQSTALQIGLLKNPNVPDLVPCLLPKGYPAACHRFLRKWLLMPPSYGLADSAHKLCRQLASPDQAGLPPLHAVPVGKAKALLLDRQCNVPFFREIHKCLSGMLSMLGDADAATPAAAASFSSDEDPDAVLIGGGSAAGGGPAGGRYSELLPHLLDLVTYQSGVEAVEDHLRDRAQAIIHSIEGVVAAGNGLDDMTFDPDGLVPEKFWWQNEAGFRGSLSLEHEATKRVYELLRQAASDLCTAVREDFPNAAQDLTYDYHNNGIYLTKLPAATATATASSKTSPKTSTRGKTKSAKAAGEGGAPAPDGKGGGGIGDDASSSSPAKAAKKKRSDRFVNPRDRFGKVMPKRFTTERVSAALSGYLAAVEETEATVRLELQALSNSLVANNDLPVIAQAAHWSVICQAMEGHVRRALSSGWSLPSLKDLRDRDMGMKVENLVPYWLPRGEAVPNTFDFRGLFLLTAPNMSGKSTVMRAVLACSLLSNAGLFAPCTSAVVPRFDGFFLRTASFDIPAEGKSAFALEMDDVRVMLRDSSDRSLALVDELGKGTSARDGASLAGALLEEMDRKSITGIFATHLHELFDLPLNTKTLSYKRMGIDWENGREPRWTFVMEDGQCTDSLALQTARKYNIPERIIARAEALSGEFDQVCRGGARGSSSSTDNSFGWAESGIVGGGGGGGDDGGDGVWWPSEDGEGWGDGSSAGGFKNMEDASKVVCRVTGRPERGLISVDSGYGTPPALEGRSCVYVLRYASLLPGGGGGGDRRRTPEGRRPSDAVLARAVGGERNGFRDPEEEFAAAAVEIDIERAGSVSSPPPAGGGAEEAGVWFYVGESDAIRERLKRHAKRWGGGDGIGGKEYKLDAVVVPVENRSEARRLETAIIRAMKDEGFHLVSDNDGSRNHFSSWK